MTETNRPSAGSSGGGIGLCGAFALLFTALKLLGYIDWSWWVVLAPLWVPAAIVLLALVFFAFAWGTLKILEGFLDRQAAKEIKKKREEGKL